ncbi:MAG: chemotaxis protein CheA [Candidatus Tectimicrobiota bacterium]
MSIDLRQLHEAFFDESFEGLDVMEATLLHVDVSALDDEAMQAMFHAAHTLKGGSSTLDFQEVTALTHMLETLLDEVCSGQRPLTQAGVDLLLQGVDCLRDMLTDSRDGQAIDQARVLALQEQFSDLLQARPAQCPPGRATAPLAHPAADGWRLVFRPHPGLLRSGNDPLHILRELSTLGPLMVQVDMSHLPALAALRPEVCYLTWALTLHSPVAPERLREVFAWVEEQCDLEIVPLAAEAVSLRQAAPELRQAPSVSTPTPFLFAVASSCASDAVDLAEASIPRRQVAGRREAERRVRGTPVEASSVRVSTDKIDALINMVGELVITQAMLNQLGESFTIERLEKLRDGLDQLERNTRELQESVMRIRMLPISVVFQRFPRLVHDLSQHLGKQVELRLSGEQTELDKTVLEKIGDPLTHLVRNSLGHGLETPAARRAAGKSAVGIIHLHAYHQGGSVIIEVGDDGAGLQRGKILRKARAQGLLRREEEVNDEKLFELIFHPGFSTADIVSDISGRGVGMDVVRRNVKELGGTIEVRSQAGRGTMFTIRLPLTLAILDGQLVRVGQHVFIIPLVSIIESLQIDPACLNRIAGQAELYQFRDTYLPILRLDDVLHLGADIQELARALLAVVEGDGQRIGLVVDELLGQQQVVIKSLETNYKRVAGIAGATILGDGRVSLILDVAGLITLAQGIYRGY